MSVSSGTRSISHGFDRVPVAQCNVGSYPRSRQRSTSRVNPRRADGPCQRVSRHRRGRSACRRPARSVHTARGMKSLRAAEARTRSSTACAGGAPSYVPSSLRPLNVLDLARRAPHQAHSSSPRSATITSPTTRPRADYHVATRQPVPKLVAEALTNNETAGGASSASRRKHPRRILLRLHARGRSQLVVITYESGLVKFHFERLVDRSLGAARSLSVRCGSRQRGPEPPA
jgi:hypothetical protein